jgi:transcriptional regulator with XRE-family HTH domain
MSGDMLIAHVVGERIRELRVDAEITQGELARRIGSHRPIISRIERGVHEPDLRTVARIAGALELELATVLVCLDADWRSAGHAERARLQEVA